MRARDALIAWTPAPTARMGTEEGDPTAGHVQIGPMPCAGDPDWPRPFAMTGGAAWAATRKLKGHAVLARLLVEFHKIVIRDGVDPQVAHEAFMAIDEYSSSIDSDIPRFARRRRE